MTKSSNHIGMQKKIFRRTHNPILLKIEDNAPFLAFPLVL
jgi:hypothetical protein